MRGYQCIDDQSLEPTKEDIHKNIFEKSKLLFEDPQNLSEFSYILDLNPEKRRNTGIITSKKIMYHQFLRSNKFKDWIQNILTSKTSFDYMLMQDIIVISINLHNKILFSLGIDQKELGIELNQADISPYLKDLKEMAYKLGSKIL